jgi:hypothetical protein
MLQKEYIERPAHYHPLVLAKTKTSIVVLGFEAVEGGDQSNATKKRAAYSHPLHSIRDLPLFGRQSVVLCCLFEILLTSPPGRIAESQFTLRVWITQVGGQRKVLQSRLLVFSDTPASQEALAKLVDRQDQLGLWPIEKISARCCHP